MKPLFEARSCAMCRPRWGMWTANCTAGQLTLDYSDFRRNRHRPRHNGVIRSGHDRLTLIGRRRIQALPGSASCWASKACNGRDPPKPAPVNLVAVAGLDEVNIAETVACPRPFPRPAVDTG